MEFTTLVLTTIIAFVIFKLLNYIFTCKHPIDYIKIGISWVPIYLENRFVNYHKDQKLIQEWASKMDIDFMISSITIIHCMYSPKSTHAKSIYMRVVEWDQETYVFLEEKCIAILVQYMKGDERYIVAMKQQRFANGKKANVEPFVGRLDDSGNICGKSIEMLKDIGIDLPHMSKLVKLDETGISSDFLNKECQLLMYNIPTDQDVSLLHDRFISTIYDNEVIVLSEEEAYKVSDCKMQALLLKADQLLMGNLASH